MAKQEKENKKQKHFWKDFKAELKKVIWPTRKQLTNNTIVVIAMVLVTTAIVLVLDLAFEALNTYGINKVKQTVKDSISTTADENENNNSEENSDDNNEENNNNENNDETQDNSEEGNNGENTTSDENNQVAE